MASAIAAARAALYSLLSTAAAIGSGTALAGVQISWGDPLAYEEQEVVALGGVSLSTADLASFDDAVDQRFTLVVRAKVYGPEDNAQTVDARGWALASAIDDVVAANRSLTNTIAMGISNRGSSEVGATPVADGPGFLILVEVDISCEVLI